MTKVFNQKLQRDSTCTKRERKKIKDSWSLKMNIMSLLYFQKQRDSALWMYGLTNKPVSHGASLYQFLRSVLPHWAPRKIISSGSVTHYCQRYSDKRLQKPKENKFQHSSWGSHLLICFLSWKAAAVNSTWESHKGFTGKKLTDYQSHRVASLLCLFSHRESYTS